MRRLASLKTAEAPGGRRVPRPKTSKVDLVPFESLLEVVPDERRQSRLAILHAIHRHPFRCARQGLQIRRRNAPNPCEDHAAGKTCGKRDRSEVLVNQAQVALVVGNADFDFLGESSTAEHSRIDIFDLICGADEEYLVAGIELAHRHQRLLDELDLVLSHEVAIVAARQKTVQLIDEQDGRTMFASPREDLHKPFGSGNVGGSDAYKRCDASG